MLSLDQCRKIDPNLKGISDEKLGEILASLYAHGNLAVESYLEAKKDVSKNPLGVQTSAGQPGTLGE